MNNQEKEQNTPVSQRTDNTKTGSPQPDGPRPGTAESRPNSTTGTQKKTVPSNAGTAEEEELGEFQVCQGIKTGASTVAGAGLGVISGIAGIAAAAAVEIVLPVSLCLWAAGVSGGAIGLLLGMGPKKKC